ncbi:PLP-dependent aminotransferase family protein [Kaustia mangrovi]|uniref:PLP-dependent aminotransferase family protein n=1 Tax=Kaustia mangrovi TaxID=2593653 RepID=A0A7S8C471_9HYPH|nr:PLP-dependent aminotransferase family protein [Kaustia mangrovi]QPC43074.1 PLP-dependent aminotransferase family protein [Kaustia mangrovi]
MWVPQALDESGPIYRALADALVGDIREGRLEEGERLPTVRALADGIGVTVGTVLRAYALAERRGFVSREAGRGTFVRAAGGRLAEDGDGTEGPVDLSRNEPPHIGLDATLRRALLGLARDGALGGLLEYGEAAGSARHRAGLAGWLGSRGLAADPADMVITGGAQQGLTIAMGALAAPGDAVLVEAYSYPGIRNLARFFGLRVVPVEMDGDGLLPDALDEACRVASPRLLYCMPHAHNPTACTYTQERRRAIAACAERHDLAIVEDDVNLRDGPRNQTPIAAMAPDRTLYISSLSKIVAPGLRVGVVVAPPALYDAVLAANQTTSWMPPPLMAELACRWIADGTAGELAAERLKISRALQAEAADHLAGIAYRADPDNSHLWIPLPVPWQADEFAARAREAGVIVSPSSVFAMVEPSREPAIRVCLSNLAGSRLGPALDTLAGLIAQRPAPARFQM